MPKPKVDPADKRAVLRAVLDLLRTDSLTAAQIAGKLRLEMGTVSNALNAARTELFVEVEGTAQRGYTYLLTAGGAAHLQAPAKASGSKKAAGAGRASGESLKALEPPPRLPTMPADEKTPASKQADAAPLPGGIEMGMSLQEKLRHAIKPSAEKLRLAINSAGADSIEMPPPEHTPDDAANGREASMQQLVQTIAAVGQKVGAATVGEFSQAQSRISKLEQELLLANESISSLEDQLRQWAAVTYEKTPDKAGQRLSKLENQLAEAQAVQLDAAVGRAAEIQRQWQAATGQETPEAAKVELNRVMAELEKVKAADAAAVGELGQVANAFARRDKRRVTGITGIQIEPEGTVLMVFDRQVSARAIVVNRADLAAWATVIEKVAK